MEPLIARSVALTLVLLDDHTDLLNAARRLAMNHPVAVRADDRQVFQSGSVVFGKLGNGNLMVAFGETVAACSVVFGKIETTSLASQAP